MSKREDGADDDAYEKEQERAQEAPGSGVGWDAEVDANEEQTERAEK